MTQEISLLTDDKKDLLKATFFKGWATQEEFELFLHACSRTGLDPFMKQIYPVKRWSTKLGRNEMTIQTGIDGFRLIGERTGKYAPGREPSYVYDKNGQIFSATAYVKKMTSDGTWHEVAATAYYAEYVQTNKDGSPGSFWKRMPHIMCAKCAESLALRKAFPADLSGIYTSDEMDQDTTDDIPVTPEVVAAPKKEEPKQIPKSKTNMITDDQASYLIRLIADDVDIKKVVDDNLASFGFASIHHVHPNNYKDFESGINNLIAKKQK